MAELTLPEMLAREYYLGNIDVPFPIPETGPSDVIAAIEEAQKKGRIAAAEELGLSIDEVEERVVQHSQAIGVHSLKDIGVFDVDLFNNEISKGGLTVDKPGNFSNQTLTLTYTIKDIDFLKEQRPDLDPDKFEFSHGEAIVGSKNFEKKVPVASVTKTNNSWVIETAPFFVPEYATSRLHGNFGFTMRCKNDIERYFDGQEWRYKITNKPNPVDRRVGAQIKGIVKDANTGIGIPLCIVAFNGFSTLTDKNGVYNLSIPKPTAGDLKVEALGYELQSIHCYPEPNRTKTQNFYLTKLTVPPAEVPPEKPPEKPPEIVYASVVNPDFVKDIIDTTAKGLGEVYNTLGEAYSSFVDGITRSKEHFEKNWQTIVSEGLMFGLSMAALGGIFNKIAAKFPGVADISAKLNTVAGRIGISRATQTTATKGAASTISPWVKMLVIWNVATDWVWIQNMLRELGEEVSGDVVKRMNTLRFTLNEQIKELNNKISFADEEQDWVDIRARLDKIIPLMDEYSTLLEKAGVKKHMPEIWSEFELMKSHLDEFNATVNKKVIPVKIPETITVENVAVVDGDTINWPGHPEANNLIRFVGIDTHEIGTTAGREEAEYLKSLIEGRTITIKVDPHEQIDMYGRLLGVPFIDDEDVTIKMLTKFGGDILVAKKYQKKHKYIDWEEYNTAARGFAEKTGEIKIYTKPAYASIWIDDKDTGKIAIETFELPAGKHKITIKKPGYIDHVALETIETGKTIEKRYELKKAGLGEEEAREEPAEAFTIYMDSEPTRAKIYIDNVYTHHLTPSDERELSNVMRLLSPGKHTIKFTKGNLAAEKEVNIVEGHNEDIFMKLEVPGLPVMEPEKPPPEEVPPVEAPELPPALPPPEKWTDEMRALAAAILTDVEAETVGAKQLSAEELQELKLKYNVAL